MLQSPLPIVCLMGPTASGKTPLAIDLVQSLPFEIISVDSAMVYRGMDIGTAKPTPDILKIAPHRLIDLVDPIEPYSAGQFRSDALREIDEIHSKGKIPLLVGGTMMYFRILQMGLADLPQADQNIRDALQLRADSEGWEAIHAELAKVDSVAANRIHPNDSQRIQRALEVYLLTGKTMTALQQEGTSSLSHFQVCNIAIAPQDRAYLHDRIALRFDQMLKEGFVEEVEKLYQRGDLSADLPSIRSIGYREMWDYLQGATTFDEMREKAIISTRQLAKRQLTWLRSWPHLNWLESRSPHLKNQVIELFSKYVSL